MIHQLPSLPYTVSALEPCIDARTMLVHHDMHHASYVKALNQAMESAPPLLQGKTAEWLMLNLRRAPVKMRKNIRNNVGGHMNHSLLWRSMSPGGGGAPLGPLANAIDRSFGSYDGFKTLFEEAGGKLFGSGWVWLVRASQGNDKLQVITTIGNDNPMTQGYVPLLVNDVWEHAYYLKHKYQRPEYLRNWWSIVNWREAEKRLERSSIATVLVNELTSSVVLEAPG